jgi:hypothetical protein
MSVEIVQGEHVNVDGMTGRGKTWLARKYLANNPPVVVLDTKGTLAWPEIPGSKWHSNNDNRHPGVLIEPGPNLTLITHLKDIRKANTPYIIYRPDPEELEEEFYNAFFQYVYLRQYVTVWVDEAMSVSINSMRIPFYYKACLTRGRERGISVWNLTQRPSNIAQVILSECTHFFVFDLNLPQDRIKLAETTSAVELLEKPSKERGASKYSFWYYNISWEHASLGYIKEVPGSK